MPGAGVQERALHAVRRLARECEVRQVRRAGGCSLSLLPLPRREEQRVQPHLVPVREALVLQVREGMVRHPAGVLSAHVEGARRVLRLLSE